MTDNERRYVLRRWDQVAAGQIVLYQGGLAEVLGPAEPQQRKGADALKGANVTWLRLWMTGPGMGSVVPAMSEHLTAVLLEEPPPDSGSPS